VKSHLESSIFDYFVEHDQKKIHLFLDGFDEISPTYKETVAELIKYFIKIKSVKLFVSTRPEMAPYLQSEFNEISFGLEPLTKSESKELLLSICKNSQHIDIFLERLLQDSELTGNPLILTMVAEILNDKDCDLDEFENDWEIFKKFVDIKNRTFLEDLDPKIGSTLQIEENMVQDTEKYLENLALRVILGDDLCRKFGVKIHDFKNIENIIVKHGLITVQDQFNQVNFIHRRFAEFYASKFFVRNLTKFDTEPIITNVSYQGLTDMIIYAISEKSTLNHIFLKSYLDSFYKLESMENFRAGPLSLFARNSETDLNDIKILNDMIEQLKSRKIDLWKFCENIVTKSFEFCSKDTINTRSIFETFKIYAVYKYGASSYFSQFFRRNFDETELKEMEKVGLIYSENGGYKFVHEIFSAYFLTSKLIENISDPEIVKFIGDEVLVDEKYSTVRLFADEYFFDLNSHNKTPLIFKVIASTSNVHKTMNSIKEKYGSEMIFKIFEFEIHVLYCENQNILIYLSDVHESNLPKILNWMRTNFDDLQFLNEKFFCVDENKAGFLHNVFERFSKETLRDLLEELINWEEILGKPLIKELILMEAREKC
jgi:hypothetical protein